MEQGAVIGDKISTILTSTAQLVLLGRQPPISKTINTESFTMVATRFTKLSPKCGDLFGVELSNQLINRAVEKGTDQSENAAVDCLMTQFS